MVRLSNTQYNRPPTTYQESLSQEQIREKLTDYVQVDDISLVPVYSELRYFVYKTDPTSGRTERLFRLGGKLLNKDHHDKYVILGNGKQSWSVSTDRTSFFRKMTIEEIHEKYQKKIEVLEATIKHLKKKLEKVKKEHA